MPRVALPGDADEWPGQVPHAVAPLRHFGRRGGDERRRGRDRLDAEVRQQRQAHQRAVGVVRRGRLAGQDDVRDPGTGAHQVRQRRGGDDGDRAAALDDAGGELQELDRVAAALFGVDEQRLAVERFAAPQRRGQLAGLAAHLLGPPPPLVLRPAAFVVAQTQQRDGPVEADFGGLGLAADRLLVPRQCLRGPAVHGQRQREIAVRLVGRGVEVDGPAQGVRRVVELAQVAVGVAQIGPPAGARRVECDCLPAGDNRLRPPGRLAERRGEVGVRPGDVRFERDLPLEAGDGLLRPAAQAADDPEPVPQRRRLRPHREQRREEFLGLGVALQLREGDRLVQLQVGGRGVVPQGGFDGGQCLRPLLLVEAGLDQVARRGRVTRVQVGGQPEGDFGLGEAAPAGVGHAQVIDPRRHLGPHADRLHQQLFRLGEATGLQVLHGGRVQAVGVGRRGGRGQRGQVARQFPGHVRPAGGAGGRNELGVQGGVGRHGTASRGARSLESRQSRW